MHGRALAATLASVIALALPASAPAATFIVTNGDDSGTDSLRAAIAAANANDNQATTRDVIQIDNDALPGFDSIDVHDTALTVTETVFISADQPLALVASGTAHDGLVFTSDAGSSTPALQPVVQDLGASGFTRGIVAAAQGLTVDGATVSGSTSSGIEITGADVFVISSAIEDGDADGVLVQGDGAVIGGSAAQQNAIGPNAGAGVRVATGGTDAHVSHNRIGTNAAGTAAAANATGVVVEAMGAQVSENLISGNTALGVQLSVCAVLVDNTIGLGAAGTAVPNGAGVEVSAGGCLVGGSAGGDGNTIGGNAGAGVVVAADDATVQGNDVGTATVGNGTAGVLVDDASGALIGGLGGAANTIRSNGGDGIQLDDAPDATVNGNTIRSNGGAGIRGTGTTTVEALGNAVLENSQLGIDVAGAAPAISSVASGGGNVFARGSFTAPEAGSYTVELFSNDACDPSGSGEGETPLGSDVVLVAGAGAAALGVEVPAVVASPKRITLTVTRQRAGLPGVTTKFSNCVEIAAGASTSFASSSSTRSETEPAVSVRVIRSGTISDPSTVAYATADGTAVAGQDYTATSGTLSFGAGEAEKTIDVPLTNDAAIEDPQTFTLALSNPSGSALGTPATHNVTVTSDDLVGLVVTDPGDSDDGTCDSDCTLREAIGASNADPGRNVIGFMAGLAPIQLAGNLPGIAAPVLIAGPAVIDASGLANALRVLPAAGGTGPANDTELFDGVRIEDTSGPAIDVDGARVVVQDAVLDGHGGIRFHGAARGAVGGAPGHGNTITAHGGDGVLLEAGVDVIVSHNTIDASAGASGVLVGSTAARVFDNAIAGGAAGAGIAMDACADVVTGNTVGGAGTGIAVRASGCQVGGAGDGNVVTAAKGSGIVVEQGGADLIANTVRANAADGVRVTGGTGTTLVGNTIRENGGRGVAVADGAGALLRGNSITANGGLGIDVAPDGVSAGAPVPGAVTREAGKLRLTGTLPAPAAGQYELELSTNGACDPSGFGEGATPVAVAAVPVASAGDAPLDVVLGADAPAGTIVTLTATRDGRTTEFSRCVTVGEAAPPPDGGRPAPAPADPRSTITYPRGRVKARRLKRIEGTARDAARVGVAAIRIRGSRCFALTRRGTFVRRTGPGRCSPARFFKANGTSTWSFRLKRRFPPGRYRIYSRATAADGTVEAPPARVRVRVRR